MRHKITFISMCCALSFTGCQSQQGERSLSNQEEQLVEVLAQDLYLEELSNGNYLDSLIEIVSVDKAFGFTEFLQSNGKVVVLRINDTNCGLCVETEIEDLQLFKSKLGNNSLIVLATFENKRNLRILTEGLNTDDVPVFLVDHGEFELAVDEMNAPYYFTLNQDLLIGNVFLPIKGVPILTESYSLAVAQLLSR